MDYIFTIMEKNQQGFLQKYDKDFLQAFQKNDKQLFEIKKKKLSLTQKKFFYDYLFCKAQQLYNKGISRLSYMLLTKNIIKNKNDEKTYKNRFNNRFKIFKNVYYVKLLAYEEYLQYMKDFCDDEAQAENAFKKIKSFF